MKYFAYGSNMDANRMKERKINFISRKFAVLPGYSLVFNKKSCNGNFSYANILPAEDKQVEGVLYEFPDREILKLDVFESCPEQYIRIEITVHDQRGNRIPAVTYIAHPDKIVDGHLPEKEYLDHLLAGKDLLSEKYIDFLMTIRTIKV